MASGPISLEIEVQVIQTEFLQVAQWVHRAALKYCSHIVLIWCTGPEIQIHRDKQQ